MTHKHNFRNHVSPNETFPASGQDHSSPMRLDDFFASPTPGVGGPVNGGGHVCLRLNSENLESVDYKDAAGVSRRALRGRLIHQGSSLLYNLFDDGCCREILDSAVIVTFIEGHESKMAFWNTGRQPEDPWAFQIELTEEQFYYLLRLVLRVDPLTGKRILRRPGSGKIEVHGDRFVTNGITGYTARLLHVIVDGEPETNEYAVNKRAFMQQGDVSH